MKKPKVEHPPGKSYVVVIPQVGLLRLDDGERNTLRVGVVDVFPAHQRKGYATKLYAEAFAEACRTGKLLVSDTMRSHIAEAFWRKQARKRRAFCSEKGRAPVYLAPLGKISQQLLAECRRTLTEEQAQLCARGRLKSYLETLPKPKQLPGYDTEHWPCYQWALDPAKCGKPLEGLFPRRRR